MSCCPSSQERSVSARANCREIPRFEARCDMAHPENPTVNGNQLTDLDSME
jgi:hypothetical protein